MADLTSLTTFPGEDDDWQPRDAVEFCQVRLVNAEDKEVGDVSSTDAGSDRDLCVELIFFTASGEDSRYIDDSGAEYIEDVMKRVLYVLGREGWRAITVTVDEENDEVWHLQRVKTRSM